MRNVPGIVLVLGIVLFTVSCNSGWDFTIVNVPLHLFCGEEFHFQVACQGSCPFPLFWSAWYGTITQDGWYRAPDFPCTEVVEVIGRGIKKLASFPVLMPGDPATPQSTAEALPSFRVLFVPPSCVADSCVPFRFTVRGSFLVAINGEVLMRDRYHREREVALELPLEEGENVLCVVLEGKEVFRSNILCDRTPPVIFLSRALWTPEGVWVFGTADEEVTIEGVKGNKNTWEVLVPWEGEKRVVWRDLGVNERTNSSGKCVGEIAMPRKVGDYTLEARLPFWEVPSLAFSVTVLAAAPRFFEDLSVLPPSGRVGEPLTFRVQVRDTYGNPCPEKTVNVYLREEGNPVKQQSVVTDAQGEASFTLIPQKPGMFTVEAYLQFTPYSLSWSLPVNDG